MSDSQDGFTPARRGFLKTVALAAGGVPGVDGHTSDQERATTPAPPAKEAPARAAFEYPRTYKGDQLNTIAFPLGGVGAGSVSLGGRGQLRDWEIFNRPDKGRSVNYAFPSIWAQVGK